MGVNRYISLERLANHDESSLILRFMLIGNDLEAAKYIRRRVAETTERDTMELDRGIDWYVTRMNMAHVHEALEVLQDAEKSKYVRSIIYSYNEASEAMTRLLECKKGGATELLWKFLQRIRDKTAFHYDKQWWSKALSISVKHGSKIAAVSIPTDETLPARWTAADEISSTVFQTHVFETYSRSVSYDDAKDNLELASELLGSVVHDLSCIVGTVLWTVTNDFAA